LEVTRHLWGGEEVRETEREEGGSNEVMLRRKEEGGISS
jgi:hypothetical protein